MGGGCCSSDATMVQNSQMAAPKQPLEIIYFDLYGRANQLRMIAWYCNVPHKSTRVSMDAHKAGKAKGIYKFGSLPVINMPSG